MFDELFKHIYVINLPSRADRRREMEVQLAQWGKSLDDPDVTLFSAFRPEDKGPFPSIGARGCFLSHLGVLKEAESLNAGIVLLEDDVALHPDFARIAPPMFEALQNLDWSIFYGGYRGPSPRNEGIFEVPCDQGIVTAHFVCFSPKVIKPLRIYLESMLARPPGDPKGGPMHVDGAYSWFRAEHPEFLTYAANPELAFQRSSRSDIANLKWFDRLPVVRNAAAIARRLVGSVK